jgi:alpha-tubulin suppressor-like RCC1 family protein
MPIDGRLLLSFTIGSALVSVVHLACGPNDSEGRDESTGRVSSAQGVSPVEAGPPSQPGPPGNAGPPSNPGPSTNVTMISAGGYHTCALVANGPNAPNAAWCWGYNQFGELGDGTTTDSVVPVSVSGLPHGASVVSISTGSDSTCAVLADGTAWCWGLMYGNPISSPIPVQVSGLPGNVNSVSIGDGNACACLDDGTAWCWGVNNVGQLGDGTTTTSLAPVQVSGLPGAVSSISASGAHTCAVLANGTAWCWGYNGSGELGDGTTVPSPLPVQVQLSGVSSISAGFDVTCAARMDGTAWCWGLDEYGQLGSGHFFSSPLPVQVPGLSGVTSISLGGESVGWGCATQADGSAWCWGTEPDLFSAFPVQVSGLGNASSVSVASMGQHACAVLIDGTAWCWGDNGNGQLGDGSLLMSGSPVQVTPSWSPTHNGGGPRSCFVTGNQCQSNSQCCSNFCIPPDGGTVGSCACSPSGAKCQTSGDCCSGVCTSRGLCQ